MGKVFKALNKYEGDPRGDSRTSNEVQEDKRTEVLTVSSVAQNSSGIEQLSDTADLKIYPRSEVGTGGQWDEKLLAFSEPSSIFSENIRKLRTKILHPASGKPLKKILVTSALPGAGKSFVCANLGIAIAQGLEQHALLVDCDLRMTKLASYFGVSSQDARGLVNYLRDDEALGGLIKKTSLDKLSIIPGGSAPSNPAELLGSGRVGQMFTELERRYDDRFIIIDTPPAALANEVYVLAKHADGIVIVVRWGHAGKEQVKQLVDSIDRDKLVGVVFNAYQANIFSSQLSGYDEYAQYGYDEYGKSA